MDGMLIIQICFAVAFAIVCIIMLFVLIGVIITRWVYERRYKKAVIDIIKRGLQKEDESVLSKLQMQYMSCSSNMFGIVITDIAVINAKVLSELNESTYKKYHDDLGDERDLVIEKLEKVISLFVEKSMFSYEKMDGLLNEISKCDDLNEMQKLSIKVKNLYETCISYCDGRLFEKDAKIRTMEYELQSLKKKKLVTNITGGIGLISGIITIITTIVAIMN